MASFRVRPRGGSNPPVSLGRRAFLRRGRLLKAWRKVALRLGQEDVAYAPRLQEKFLARWEDWDAALDAFHQAEGSAGATTCERLFADWRRRASEEIAGTCYLLPEVMEFWKRNAALLVPDPAHAGGSDYTACAEWLAVVLDLDPPTYTRILQDWSVRHRRRRNLWQALRKRRLPLEDQD